MDALARRAGVGFGTLYRHFPDRVTLLEAVYREEIASLSDAARRLIVDESPLSALRAWMLLFVDYIDAKRLIAPALRAAAGDECPIFAESGAAVKEAMRTLIDRAIASGEIRPETDPLDLLRAIAGLAYIASDAGWKDSARRLVEILLAGSRP